MMGTQLTRLPWLLAGLLCLASGWNNNTRAQGVVKTKTTTAYYISPTDTTLRFRRAAEYDAQKRLISQTVYHYDISRKGVLTKEEQTRYQTDQQLLREQITTYPRGAEPKSELFETRYLVYAAEEANSKRIWKRHFDAFGEITKEDTLTYDANGLLLNKCAYNYMGSTSILCDEWEYRDTFCTRWRMYSRWTTINGRSQVVERRSKRRDYRYFYNKRGQLKRVKALDYGAKIKRCLQYDRDGALVCDYKKRRRKTSITPKSPDGKPDASKKKRKVWSVQESLKRYEGGNLVVQDQRKDGYLVQRQRFIYDNGQLVKEEKRRDTLLVERILHTYNDAGLRQTTTQVRYHPDGRERYRILTQYNDQALPQSQEQFVGPRRISRKEWTYNDDGLPTLEVLSRSYQKLLDQQVYEYTYH